MARKRSDGEQKDAAYYARLADEYHAAKDAEKSAAARVLQRYAEQEERQRAARDEIDAARTALGEEA